MTEQQVLFTAEPPCQPLTPKPLFYSSLSLSLCPFNSASFFPTSCPHHKNTCERSQAQQLLAASSTNAGDKTKPILKMNKHEILRFLAFKTSYKVTVIKMVWFTFIAQRQAFMPADQNRLQVSETNPLLGAQMVVSKGAMPIQCPKSLSTNGVVFSTCDGMK